MKIKDSLKIDLSEDIKNVIDLEDLTEKEIQSEIENYIVTDGLAREYNNFVSTYTSNIVETGVWISGFYGSGKSYFGKLLGYMLSNRNISGTPARERILQRFTGINDEAITKNTINRLDSHNSMLVFLNIAQQDTSKGFSYCLFKNFLRTLSLPENEHGYLIFLLMLKDKMNDIYQFIINFDGSNWDDYKGHLLKYTKLAKNLFLSSGNSESDYSNIITTIRNDINQFSPAKLRDELSNYLKITTDIKLVFLFDEASQAIYEKKLDLLELGGVSEALSTLGGKVWTIAIAQEKLDEVINNTNVNKTQITKVTDRFKTKIHIEATEVDVIIRNRLLNKTDSSLNDLKNHFQDHSGKISDHAALNGSGITKTDNIDSYITYYPFYKYQFDLLQNFLFGTKGYASTLIATRGMIITTYDILKHQVQHKDLFEMVTGWEITKEAQPQPDVRIVNRYDNAERILREAQSSISGRKLLETIHFLVEAEVAPATLINITKAYVPLPELAHQIKIEISKALEVLTDAKILLGTNNTYRITTDIEQRLLDEMNGFTVQGFNKKKQTVVAYKTSNFIKNLSTASDSEFQYEFYITTDNDDELTNPALKQLKIGIKSIYTFSDNRSADIEDIRIKTQNDKDILWVIPDNQKFRELDKIIDEVERITYLEQNYNNPNTDEGKILLGFSIAKSEKQIKIKELIEQSLSTGTIIYLYNSYQLTPDNWKQTVNSIQKQIIQNVYSKRLNSQLSDGLAKVIILESNPAKYCNHFNGDDFMFFDPQGNFIGDNLKVVQEILYKIRNTYINGQTLEKELEAPPTGFSFGTVISTLAALMKAGKVIAKYNGSDLFSWRDQGVSTLFSASREFRKADFKAVSKNLSLIQKQTLAQFLIDVSIFMYRDKDAKHIDYNTNDFELVNAVRDLAKFLVNKVDNLRTIEKDFDKLFPILETQKDFLAKFTGAVSEPNYVDKAVTFLAEQKDFKCAMDSILKTEKFISQNLPKVKEWKYFVDAVSDELIKSTTQSESIDKLKIEFTSLFNNNIVDSYSQLQAVAQKIKDEYHSLFKTVMENCSIKYSSLKVELESLLSEIDSLPANLNDTAKNRVSSLLLYATGRTANNVELNFDVKEKNSRFTYSEVLSFIDLYNAKKTETEIIKASLIRDEKPTEPISVKKKTKTYSTSFPGNKLKVSVYKNWLQNELHKLSSADDDDDVSIAN